MQMNATNFFHTQQYLTNVRFGYHDLVIVIFRHSFLQAKGQSMLPVKPFVVAFWTGYT